MACIDFSLVKRPLSIRSPRMDLGDKKGVVKTMRATIAVNGVRVKCTRRTINGRLVDVEFSRNFKKNRINICKFATHNCKK